METNKNEALENANKYMRALTSDCVLYFSSDRMLATSSRKEITKNSLQLVKHNLDIIEKLLD